MRVLLVFSICVAYSLGEEVVTVTARDSYLDAYQQTSKQTTKPEKRSDNIYPVYSGPSGPYGSSGDQYGPPNAQYGPPNPQYGPPNSQYGPPFPQYGPPAPQYGPPPSYGTFAEPVPQYGPPIYGPPAQNLQVFYGVPHAMISIWDKLWEKIKFKLNLFTLGKILLKLVIFKKIVSLIAILCLLLFIPSLKHKKGLFHEEEADRNWQRSTNADQSLNKLASFVTEAIENYMSVDKNQSASCDTVYCRTQKALKKIEKKMSYKKLAEQYTNKKGLK